jgi:pimeloyl-ACP methyl ester carboxylesterase
MTKPGTTWRRVARPALTLIAAAGLAGAPGTTPSAGDGTPPSAPSWAACPADVVTAVPLECATVPVPLDHDAPDGERIEIMISRLAGPNPTERRSILLTNPGGPGAGGLAMPGDLAQRGMPSSVLDAYDVIGMDPRGVGHSSPVSCRFTVGQAYGSNASPYAPDAAAVAAHAEVSRGVADQCAANDPTGRMRHMTTANAARDMDAIRVALGEPMLSFFGASYGSGLGAAYASLFPERSDRIVVDSNLGGTVLDRDTQRRFALGLEDRFPDLARWVAARDASYGLGRTPREARAHYLALASRLDEQPVAGIDGATFRMYTFAGTYGDESFPTVAQLWQALAAGDPEAVRRAARPFETVPGAPEPEPAADDAPSPADNFLSAYLAYLCNDSEWPGDLATYQRDVATDRKRYPLYGAAAANINPCAFWHHDPLEPPLTIDDDGPRNVLVMQNLRDPATPHLAGQIARRAFGDRARLVTVDDGGHGVYVFGDNACALNTGTTFLLTGDLPKRDVHCRASGG